MTSMIDYNGVLYPANEPLLKIIDNGFYYGLGIYETLYIKNSSVAFYEEHIRRLIRCADFFRIQFSESYIQKLKLRIQTLIRTENAVEGRLRLTFSTGTYPLDTDTICSENLSSCISIQKISIKKDSISLYISSYKKQYPSFFPPYVKYTANYPSILSFQEAIKTDTMKV